MRIKKKTELRNPSLWEERFTKEVREFLKKNGGERVAKYLRSGS